MFRSSFKHKVAGGATWSSGYRVELELAVAQNGNTISACVRSAEVRVHNANYKPLPEAIVSERRALMTRAFPDRDQVGHRLIAMNVVIAVLLPALMAFGQVADMVTLDKAMRDGKVVATFRGTGGSSGDSVKVQVAKTPKAGPGPLKLTVPPGSMLHSVNGAAQSMVIMGVRGRRQTTPVSALAVQLGVRT